MADNTTTPARTSAGPQVASPSKNDVAGGLTDSNEDNEVALRSMIQQIAAGHTHLTEAVIGSGVQFDVTPLPLTAEQKTTNGWSKEDLELNEKFQQDATKALKAISTWKEVVIAQKKKGDKSGDIDALDRRAELMGKELVTYWDSYVATADANDGEAEQLVKEYVAVSSMVGEIAARSKLASNYAVETAAAAAAATSTSLPGTSSVADGKVTITHSSKSISSSGGSALVDHSTKSPEDMVLTTPPFVPNSLYRVQEDAQVLRCGAFKLKPPEGTFRTTNSLKACLEKTATKAIHRSVRPTGASSDQFLTFMPIDGKSVALNMNTCVDLDDMLLIHMWRNKQEGMRFQLSMLAIGNSFTQHGLGLGVFAAPLCVSVRHLCQYFTVLWLAPIVSKAPLCPPPPITAAVLNLVKKRCGSEGELLDVYMGVDGRRYVLPPQGIYLPPAVAPEANNQSPRAADTNKKDGGENTASHSPRTINTGAVDGMGLRAKHRRPEAVLRNKPSEDPDNQVNTAAGRQMAVLKKIIGITRASEYTINSAACLDAVPNEFSAEGVCIRDLRAVFYNENSWAGVGKDLKRVMLMRSAAFGGAGGMLDIQLGVRLAKLQNEVRNLIFAQVVGRTIKALIESVIMATPSDLQIALVNHLITRPLFAIIERKARGVDNGNAESGGAAALADPSSYGDMANLVKGLADAINSVAAFKYPVPSSSSSNVAFDVLSEPVPVLLAGLQLACRKLFLTLNLGERKSITSMASRPIMIAAAVTSPPQILEKDAPISRRVSALEARFGMVDLVPADQPVMRFLTLQRACFALGVLMKSAVGCSPDDKNLIQELVEDVLPTMIRGEEESHDVTTIPYVTSVFPFAVAANITFAALNAVNTVIVSISRLYPDYGAIPTTEKTVILSILRQLLIEMKRPDPSKHHHGKAEGKKKKKKKKRSHKVGGKTPGGTNIMVDASPNENDLVPDEADPSGRVQLTFSEKKRRKHKEFHLDSPTGSPTTKGMLTAANLFPDGDGAVRRTSSNRSHTSSRAEGSDYTSGDSEGSEELEEDGSPSRLKVLGPLRLIRKGVLLTDEQKADLAAARAEQEKQAAEKLKELLNKAKKLDEARPSYQARLAAKRAIALAGVQDLYYGFDDDEYGGGGGGGEATGSTGGSSDLDAFLANYAKNAANVAAADAAMNANNKVSTVATEAAERDALAKELAGIGGGRASFAGPMQQSVNFDLAALTSQPSITMAASIARNQSFVGLAPKKSMIQKATELEEEDMTYLLDDDGDDLKSLSLVDCAKVFGIEAKELLKNNSFFIHAVDAPIPHAQTLSLPPYGKPEVIESAASRLGLNAPAVLKHNPSFKPKDIVPATHSLTVPLPLDANLATKPEDEKKAKGKEAKVATPAAEQNATEPQPKKPEACSPEPHKEKKKGPSPKKAAEIAAALAATAEIDRHEREEEPKRRHEKPPTPTLNPGRMKTPSNAAATIVPPMAIAAASLNATPTPPKLGDYSLSKASRKFNLDSKAVLKANPDIDGTKAPIHNERIIALPEQVVTMTVKEAAAQLGVSAQLVFDCNSVPLKLKTLMSEIREGSTIVLPAAGEAYDGVIEAAEAFHRRYPKEQRQKSLAEAENSPPPRKEKKEKREKDSEEEAVAAMEREINGKKKEKKDKKDKDASEKKEKKSKKSKGESSEGDNQEVASKFERAMNNPIIRRLSTAYGYDPLDLLMANPHLHGATESTPIHGMISLPPREEPESVASAADRLGLTPRDLMLLNPGLANNDDVPPRFVLSVPANPPSSCSSRSSSSGHGGVAVGDGKVFLSDGLKFDKRLRPDQTGGLGPHVPMNTGQRDNAGLDRASALLKRASLARQNSLLTNQQQSFIGSPGSSASPGVSGTFHSPLGSKQQQLRSLNATPNLGLPNTSFGMGRESPNLLSNSNSDSNPGSKITPLRQQNSSGSGFGHFGGLPSSITNRGTPSPVSGGFPSPTNPATLGNGGRLASLAPVGGR